MQNVPALAVPLDPLASYIYIQNETSHTCQQPSPSFAWILSLRNIIFPIIDEWSWSSNVPFYEKEKIKLIDGVYLSQAFNHFEEAV